MANFAMLAVGRQAVTATAQSLGETIPPNPLAGSVRGEGFKLIIGNLAASTASLVLDCSIFL